MPDDQRTRAELVAEVRTLRRRVADLEAQVRPAEGRHPASVPEGAVLEDEVGRPDLAEIIDVEALQSLMDDFFDLTGIGAAIVDRKGEVLVATGWQDICTQFHRVHPETRTHCLESDTILSSDIATGEVKLYKCKNNLWDMATPITVSNARIGTLFLGQFFFDDETVDREFFRQQAQRYGFDEDAYMAALDRVPRWPRETVETVFRFYARLAAMISQLSHSNLEMARALVERDRLLAARRRAEEARRRSEAFLRQVIDASPNCVFVKNWEGEFVLGNQAVADLYETTPAAMVGKTARELLGRDALSPEAAARLLADDRAVIDSGEPLRIPEERVTLPDGSTRYFQTVKVRLDTDWAPDCMLGVAVDITERKRMERELRRQERLAAVGQLAAGIAHDFRNVLSTIILYAQMDLRKSDLPAEVAEDLHVIVTESKKAADLVQQILDFSSRAMIDRCAVDLWRFTERVLEVLGRTIPETIRIWLEVATDADERAFTVWADRGRIQQVLTNLALNARDAMPHGGTLRFELSHLDLGADETAPVAGMAPGPWVCLAVSDDGTGMTEAVQAHLFEPFFTTKDVDEGTGLGLAQVYGIIRQHKGVIDVESAPGQGTTFRIYLPAYAGDPEDGEDAEAGETSGPTRPHGQGATVLVVEDNATLRTAAQSILESLGYRVLTAVNGREALALCQSPRWAEGDPAIDLVITDLVMPDMGGDALVRALMGRDGSPRYCPKVKVLGITGYALEDVTEDLRAMGFFDVIRKPFDAQTLAQAVRRALD
jgi:PAS domain S-box-containing protein